PPGTTSTDASAPDAGSAPAEPPQDNPEVVAVLEELGVRLKRDHHGRIVELNASEIQGELTDEHVVKIAGGLPALVSVNLDYTQVSNEGLAQLEKLPNLRALSLRRCPNIDDAGLVHLTKLPKLERLSVLYNSNSITDASMEHVGQIQTLRLLDLRGCTQISDAGLEHLKGLTNLVDLKLLTGEVSNEGVAHLSGL